MAVDRSLVTKGRATRARAGRTDLLARAVSDTLGPLPPLVALCAAAATHRSALAGTGWGLVAMFFVAILPYLATWKIRHPAGGGRPSPAARATYMGVAVVTGAGGLGVLYELDAPAELVSAVIAILVSLAVSTVTNARWGWSNHMAACCAGVAMLIVLLGPVGFWAVTAIPCVAWARLALRRHVVGELVLGGVVGAVVSSAVLLLLI